MAAGPQNAPADLLRHEALRTEPAAPSLLSMGLLLTLVPPVGIFAVWSLPNYPREGKVAASVGAMVWMLMLGLAALL